MWRTRGTNPAFGHERASFPQEWPRNIRALVFVGFVKPQT